MTGASSGHINFKQSILVFRYLWVEMKSVYAFPLGLYLVSSLQYCQYQLNCFPFQQTEIYIQIQKGKIYKTMQIKIFTKINFKNFTKKL